uniref:hypothetical protein n=1 Tax=Roseiconus lacunae TaxID=2605694 RepID=UPI00193F2EBF
RSPTEMQRLPHDMDRQDNVRLELYASPDTGHESGFVADGYERLISAVESDARQIVEAKYADEWNASGLLRRWNLQRKMDAEISAMVAEMMPDVSPDALF